MYLKKEKLMIQVNTTRFEVEQQSSNFEQCNSFCFYYWKIVIKKRFLHIPTSSVIQKIREGFYFLISL